MLRRDNNLYLFRKSYEAHKQCRQNVEFLMLNYIHMTTFWMTLLWPSFACE